MKAKSMTSHIAYPDELLEVSKLEDFYEKVRFVSCVCYKHNISKILVEAALHLELLKN